MKRDLYKKLAEWKNSDHRKPLVVKGARQVGKTYLIKEFGAREYQGTAYLNFEQDPGLNDFFRGRKDPNLILERLSIFLGQVIHPEKTLIILDEVQASPDALGSLKYFQEEAGRYHVVAAGSLLGLMLGESTPFPVGKVSFLDMQPLSFGEFLDAMGRDPLRSLLEDKRSFEPLEAGFHQDLLYLLRLYYFIGGMPEAVARYADSKDLKEARRIHGEILTAYAHDFSKHASKSEAVRISRVWDAIPGQLAKENKKFQFSRISRHARSRDFSEPLQWLVRAGLVHECRNVKTPRLPLSGYREEGIFKVYLLDVGLLGAMLGLTEKTVVDGNRLFSEYHGAFVENYTAQELIAGGHKDLFYWTSGGLAEVDFVVPHEEMIFPLEVKAGVSTKKKSLVLYGEKFGPPLLSRATLMNFKRDGIVCNFPLYGISRFPTLALEKSGKALS